MEHPGYFPAGGGIWGFDSGTSVFGNGTPSNEAILKLAKPIAIPVRQHFSALAEWFTVGTADYRNGATSINTGNSADEKIIMFMVFATELGLRWPPHDESRRGARSYMLEPLRIRRYAMRNNPSGAGNQQGRPFHDGTLRGHTLRTRKGEDMVRTAQRCAETGGTETTCSVTRHGNKLATASRPATSSKHGGQRMRSVVTTLTQFDPSRAHGSAAPLEL